MTDQEQPKQFSIQKLYLKDMSFESPLTPEAFNVQQWSPKIDLSLNNSQTKLKDDLYEIVLRVTVTATHEDKTAFLIEVHQAGIFAIQGFEQAELQYLMSSQAMSILFPYAREVVSDLSVRGGYVPVILSPVNFDALFQKSMQKAQAEAAEQTTQ